MSTHKRSVQRYSRWLARHWILGAAGLLILLNLYTFTPTYAQNSTPTPNIQTVPQITITPTTANTPVPTATPDSEDATATPLPPTQVNEEPTATPQPSSNNNGNNNNNGGSAPAASLPAAGSGSTAPQSQSGITLTAAVNVTTLNMRRGPSMNESVIDTLFKKDVVEVLARTQDGKWWLICCGNRTKAAGWVDAQTLQPNFDRARANELIPLAVELTTFSTISSTTTSGLQFNIQMEPAYVWQGQTLQMKLTVTNLGTNTARNVRIRDQLPKSLRYVRATADAKALVQQQAASDGGKIITSKWPTLAAGKQVTLTLTLQIEGNLPAGALIDNLAVASAEGIQAVTSGITFAMPPLTPPVFH